MTANKTTNPTKSEIQQTQNAIRRSWSPEERDERRRLAASRQKWLFNMSFTERPTAPARVA
jgi:hypothetical protein